MGVSQFVTPGRYTIDFEEEKYIGEGTFSFVYCARHRFDGVRYAIKKLIHKYPSTTITQAANSRHAVETRKVCNEVCALAALQGCPQIVQYFNSWMDDEGRVFIQTEYCELGNLDSFIQKPQSAINSRSIASRGRSLSYQATPCSQEPNNDFSEMPPPSTPKDVTVIISRNSFRETKSNSSSYQTTTESLEATSRLGCASPTNETVDCQISQEDGEMSDFKVSSQRKFGGGRSEIIINAISDSEEADRIAAKRWIPEEIAWLVLHEIGQALQFIHYRGNSNEKILSILLRKLIIINNNK